MRDITPIDEELFFDVDELIVTKTDTTGRITYANDVFCRLAEMSNDEVLGQPHSLIRHPDMPRAVFKLLWDTVLGGHEIFAYVKNMSSTGRYYWVIAHVTPSFSATGEIIGFHSNRRVPDRDTVAKMDAFYQQLRAVELGNSNRKEQLESSYKMFQAHIAEHATSYEEYIWGLGG